MENSTSAETSNWVASVMSAYAPRCGEIVPNTQRNMPIGNTAQWVTNFRGNKFSRGWLDGAGGQQVEDSLGSTAFAIRPTPYNGGAYSAALRSVGPAAPVPGLSNMDINTPGRTWNPISQFAAEWNISNTHDLRPTQDLVSGQVGPTIATAQQPIYKSPTPQMYWRGQVRMDAEADPSVPYAPPPSVKAKAAGTRAKAM